MKARPTMPPDPERSLEIRCGRCALDAATEDAVLRWADSGFRETTGYDCEQDGPLRYTDLVHRDDRQAFWTAVLGEIPSVLVEHRLMCADGHMKYVASHVVRSDSALTLAIIDLESIAQLRRDADRIIEHLPCGLVCYDVSMDDRSRHDRLVCANRAFYALIGYTEEVFLQEYQGQILRVADRESAARVKQATRRAIAVSGKPQRVEFAVSRPDGRETHLMVTIVDVGASGTRHFVLCTYQDITSLVEARRSMRTQQERIALAAAANNERISEYNVAMDQLVYLSETNASLAYGRILRHFLVGRRYMDLMHPDDAARFEQAWQQAIRAPQNGAIDVRMRHDRSGEMVWTRIHYMSDAKPGQPVSRILTRSVDIDAQKRHEFTLRAQAERDALTDVYSRGVAEEMIGRFLLQENAQHSPNKHAVMMLDLDNFKEVNDRYGHAYCDAVLAEVAQIIQSSLRASDIVGRLGGDEFIMLMKNYRDKATLSRVAERICRTIDTRFAAAAQQAELSCSIGIACYAIHGTSMQTLYEKADLANYEAKALGKNRWEIYSSSVRMRYHGTRRGRALSDAALLQGQMERTLLSILRSENNKRKAIEAALAVMARYYSAQRAYIAEFDDVGALRAYPYLWCEAGYALPRDSIPTDARNPFWWQFDEAGIHIIRISERIPKTIRTAFQAAHVQSMVHFAYKRGGEICGFIGMDDCIRSQRSVTPKILDEVTGAMRLLRIFVQDRTPSERATEIIVAAGLYDALDSYVYIIDPETHELVFINRAIMARMPGVSGGDLCYTVLHGRTTPCDVCLLTRLRQSTDDPEAVASVEMPFHHWGFTGKVFAGWLRLGTSRPYCLFQCMDITPYRERRKEDGA